jgi:hypothetical protein
VPADYHPAVIPLVLAIGGFVLLVAGVVILRRLGPAFRVGRLLASTPRVTVADAVAFARAGRRTYVAVSGRIDSEAEFESADHRPLVLRRTRFERRRGDRWEPFEERREAVDFELHEGLDAIGIDHAVLDEGLVVVPRVADGVAADLGAERPDDLDPATTVRARIDQISSVEHAVVLGVPVAGDPVDTAPVRLTAGLGRPLVLTTLEPPEAMRLLAAETPLGPRLGGILLGAGLTLVAVALFWQAVAWLTGTATAAETPTPGAAGDPRSSGEGPGFVGEPLLAILAVLGIAVASLLLVQAYVVATRRRR